jgi:hypothetical protein
MGQARNEWHKGVAKLQRGKGYDVRSSFKFINLFSKTEKGVFKCAESVCGCQSPYKVWCVLDGGMGVEYVVLSTNETIGRTTQRKQEDNRRGSRLITTIPWPYGLRSTTYV